MAKPTAANMREKPFFSLFGMALLLAATPSSAGGAAGQFGVQITLNGGANSCTSASSSGTASSSVQVQCNANVFVSIAPVVNPQSNLRFVLGFRPGRDSLLPDYCRSEQTGLAGQMARVVCGIGDSGDQLADAGDDTGDARKIQGQLYALDSNATAQLAQAPARPNIQKDGGTQIALLVPHAEGHFGPVEMLVFF